MNPGNRSCTPCDGCFGGPDASLLQNRQYSMSILVPTTRADKPSWEPPMAAAPEPADGYPGPLRRVSIHCCAPRATVSTIGNNRCRSRHGRPPGCRWSLSTPCFRVRRRWCRHPPTRGTVTACQHLVMAAGVVLVIRGNSCDELVAR